MVALTDLSWVYFALVVLFAGIFVAVLVALVRQGRVGGGAEAAVAAPEPARSGSLADAMAVPGAVADPYLLRFVEDESGARVGEALAVAGDELVLKRDDGFHAVPLSAVRIEGERLVASDVDWERARERGESWRAEQAAQHEALRFDEAAQGP